MALQPEGDLNLSALRPKGSLVFRTMAGGEWRGYLFLGCFAALIGAILTVGAGPRIRLERRYKNDAKIVTATIDELDIYVRGSSQGGTRFYRVSYTFVIPGGARIKGQQEVYRYRWEALAEGQQIDVAYLPGNESVNRPTYASRKDFSGSVRMLIIAPACMFALALLCVLRPVRYALRNAPLLRYGKLTTGTVEDVRQRSKLHLAGGQHSCVVDYRFDLPGGRSVTGRDVVSSDFARTLAPGGPAKVAYLPSNPTRNSLFRPDWLKFYRNPGLLKSARKS